MSSSTGNKKIIAVVGATGNQGGSVVRDLLKDGEFAVRGLTRNANGRAAQELKNMGVEMVQANNEDVDSLVNAFQGCYGVFGNTDFWNIFGEHQYDAEKTAAHETRLGTNLVRAAERANIQHFVWSTLDHNDKLHVYHFESKFAVNEVLEKSGIPYTHLYTSAYYENSMGMWLKKDNDGNVMVNMGLPADTKIHLFDPLEIGRWVVPIFKNPTKYANTRVDAVSEYITPREFHKIAQAATGMKMGLQEMTAEEFEDPDFKAQLGDELWLNNKAWKDAHFKRDMEQSYSVVPDPTTLERYLKTNKEIREYLGLSDEKGSADMGSEAMRSEIHA